MADRALSSEADFERHWLEQVRRGLELTPAQRLAWLEATISELAGWVGRARLGERITTQKK